MKILMINNYLNTHGGTEVIFWREISLLLQAGHTVKVWGMNTEQPTGDTLTLYEQTVLATYLLPCIDKRALSTLQKILLIFSFLHQSLTPPKLQAVLATFQPDIIHVHNWQYHITGSFWHTLKSVQPRIPVVHTIHDTRLLCPSGKYNPALALSQSCQQGGVLACVKKPCKNNSLGETAFGLMDNLWQQTTPMDEVVTRYIIPSQTLATALLTAKAIKPEKTSVLINALDDSFFTVLPDTFTPVDALQPNILFVGRLSEEKGVHVLLEALSNLPSFFTLTIVGEGSQEATLKQQAITLGIAERVAFVGKKTPAQVLQLFTQHWISVLPCQWFEIFGLTLAESMAVGCPVIASNLGAMPELLGVANKLSATEAIAWGERGLLFQSHSTTALANAIMALWQAPERYVKLREAGWAWARNTLQAHQHGNQLQQIYESCLLG
jgi:glycosyltransferase involved in cell wall biosynthesis